MRGREGGSPRNATAVRETALERAVKLGLVRTASSAPAKTTPTQRPDDRTPAGPVTLPPQPPPPVPPPSPFWSRRGPAHHRSPARSKLKVAPASNSTDTTSPTTPATTSPTTPATTTTTRTTTTLAGVTNASLHATPRGGPGSPVAASEPAVRSASSALANFQALRQHARLLMDVDSDLEAFLAREFKDWEPQVRSRAIAMILNSPQRRLQRERERSRPDAEPAPSSASRLADRLGLVSRFPSLARLSHAIDSVRDAAGSEELTPASSIEPERPPSRSPDRSSASSRSSSASPAQPRAPSPLRTQVIVDAGLEASPPSPRPASPTARSPSSSRPSSARRFDTIAEEMATAAIEGALASLQRSASTRGRSSLGSQTPTLLEPRAPSPPRPPSPSTAHSAPAVPPSVDFGDVPASHLGSTVLLPSDSSSPPGSPSSPRTPSSGMTALPDPSQALSVVSTATTTVVSSTATIATVPAPPTAVPSIPPLLPAPMSVATSAHAWTLDELASFPTDTTLLSDPTPAGSATSLTPVRAEASALASTSFPSPRALDSAPTESPEVRPGTPGVAVPSVPSGAVAAAADLAPSAATVWLEMTLELTEADFNFVTIADLFRAVVEAVGTNPHTLLFHGRALDLDDNVTTISTLGMTPSVTLDVEVDATFAVAAVESTGGDSA